MGNCQAAEAATVVIQHPGGGKVERIYWSVNASEVMNSNPGHYVAMIVASSAAAKTESGGPVRQLKLLRPDDTLLIGHVYRLISFEDVLKEFNAKKSVRLGKLKERGAFNMEPMRSQVYSSSNSNSEITNAGSYKTDQHVTNHFGSSGGGSRSMGRNGQWRPALQSIAEAGS